LPAEGVDQVVKIDFSQGKDLFCQRLLPLIVCKSIACAALFLYQDYIHMYGFEFGDDRNQKPRHYSSGGAEIAFYCG
jgi:hypothetical protein